MFLKFQVLATLLGITNFDRCSYCICHQESGCTKVGCKMDRGSLSCGYYQIKLPYYIDCGEIGKGDGESTEHAWKRCSDEFGCSTFCVLDYFNKYASRCPEKSGCEARARIHNGGPNGCKKKATDEYWNRIKECLEQK